MATVIETIKPGASQGDGSSTIAGLNIFPFANGEDTSIEAQVPVPVGYTSIGYVRLYFLREYIGNLYLRFWTSREPGTSGAYETDNSDSLTAYPVTATDGQEIYITIPVAAYNAFILIAGDHLGIQAFRGATNSLDTYEAMLKAVRIDVCFNLAVSPDVPAGYYCSQADLEARLGTKTLAQLTNDADGATIPDSTIVYAMIGKADGIIDGYASQVYTTPFAVIDPLVRDIAIDLACYFAMQRRFTEFPVPNDWISTKKDRIQQLEDISNQVITLISTIAVSSSEANFLATTPVIDFNDSENAFSNF